MILLFDLAGVLLEFRGIESTWELSNGVVGADTFAQFWSKSPVADRLYRGQCTPSEFAAAAVSELALSVSTDLFLSEFRRWLIGPYPGAFELLEGLGKRHRLACLSNTNELDCERFRAELRLDERFDRCFFSNEIGLRKPDAACYGFLVDALKAKAVDIIFFDDSQECVEGARAAGLRAHQCVGMGALIERLKSLELA